MKRYILNSGNHTIHKSESKDKRCKTINKENIKEYDTLEEIYANSDSYTKVCKICMGEDILVWRMIQKKEL